jgi:hypothetical protein
MALFSQMMRTAAITGRTDAINAWFAGRQGGRWATQMAGSVLPKRAPAHAAESLRELTKLHRSGVVTDAEFERLRSRLHA